MTKTFKRIYCSELEISELINYIEEEMNIEVENISAYYCDSYVDITATEEEIDKIYDFLDNNF